MGKIRVYQARTGVPTARARTGLVQPTFSAADFPSIEGVKQIGQTMLNVQKQEDAKTRLDMRSAIAKERIEIAKQVAQMERSAELGAPGHVEASEALVGQSLERLKAKYGDRFSAEVEANFADVHASTVSSAMRFQAAQSGAKMAHDIKSVTDSNLEAIIQDPKTGMPVAMQDFDKTQASLLAAGHDPKAVAEAMDAERTRAWDTYSTSLISKAGSDQELDAIKEDLDQKGGMLSEGMSPKGVATAFKLIEQRRDDIKKDAHNQRLEAGRAAMKNVDIGFQADRAAADDPAAQQRLSSGHWTSKYEAIYRKFGIGREGLSSASSARASAIKARMREIKYDRASAQDYADIQVGLDAMKGGANKQELDELLAAGKLSMAGYKTAIRYMTAYQNKMEAQDAGNAKELQKWTKELAREEKRLMKEQVRIKDANTLHDIRYGITPPDKVDEAIAGLSPINQSKGKAAHRTWLKSDAKDKAREQKRVMQQEKGLIVEGLLTGAYDDTKELGEAVEDFADRWRDVPGGLDVANALRRTAMQYKVDDLAVARITAAFSSGMSSYAQGGAGFYMDLKEVKEAHLGQALREAEEGFKQEMRESEGADPTPTEVLGFRKQLSLGINNIPEQYVHGVQAKINSSDRGVIIEGVHEMRQWEALHPQFANKFKGDEYAFAKAMDVQMDNGLSGEEAYDLVTAARDASPVEKDGRRKDWDAHSKPSGSRRDPNHHIKNTSPREGVEGDQDFLDLLDDDMTTASIFNGLAKEHFLAYGDIESARRFALGKMRQTWHPTKIGGEERLMRLAPDAEYAVLGLSGARNAKWMGDQFAEQVSKRVGAKVPIEAITVLLDPSIKNGGRPTYMALYRGSVVMRGAVPDENASGYVRNEKIVAKAVAEKKAADLEAETKAQAAETKEDAERSERLQTPGGGRGVVDPFETRRQSIKMPKLPGFTGAPLIDETGS